MEEHTVAFAHILQQKDTFILDYINYDYLADYPTAFWFFFFILEILIASPKALFYKARSCGKMIR